MIASRRCAPFARVASARALSIQLAIFAFASAALADRAAAQLCVQLNGSVYRQNFNTLPVSGSSNNLNTLLPTGFAASENGTGNNVTFAADDGDLTAGNTYSFGTAGSTDRAFGELDNGTFTSILGGCFVNNTGFVIPSFSIAYTGEQWRLGDVGGTLDKLDFQYSTTATTINSGTWTNVDTLDFSTPSNSGAVGGRDGNLAANQHVFPRTAIIPPTGIAMGATFFIRWVPTILAGANDGLAIDDFELTYSPSPDFDLDRDVDGIDFLAMQRGFGTTSGASISMGDSNKDGIVDGIDKLIWVDRYGTTADAPPAVAAVASVPEPATAWLLCAAAVPFAAVRRRV